MKIVIDNKIPFIKGALEKQAEVVYLPGNQISSDVVRDADALIVRTRTKCNRELLEGSSVKFIATATIGFDHLDTKYLEANGIAWTNAPGCNSSSVEQYIVSVLLYLADLNDMDPADYTLGVIGVGNVGKKVARAAGALGYRVIINDPPREQAEGSEGFVSLDTLLQEADIVTMHVPLTRQGEFATLGMANKTFFQKMKEGSVFINSSRGEVVVEKELKEAIRASRFSEVIMDVFEKEPNVDKELLSMITIGTPHIAGYSADGKANGTEMSVQALSRFFGLGMDDWKPSGVPKPANSRILVDGSDAEENELLTEVYFNTYNVMEDHDRFMDHQDAFEKLRGDYRIRREPTAFSVQVFNDDGKYRKILEQLGFDVIGDSCF